MIVSTKKVFLLFNKSGDFLVVQKLDFNNVQTKETISHFLTGAPVAREKDQIYSLRKGLITDKIISEDKQYIYVAGPSDKIDKKTVVAVIYKDGHHVLNMPAEKAAPFIWENKPAAGLANAEIRKDIPAPQKEPVKQPESKKDTPVIGTRPGVLVTTEQKPAKEAAHPLSFEEVAGNVSKAEFEKKALQKTNQLNIYLKIICSRTADYEEINKAIDQSMALFVDENAMIETSSINRNDVKRYKIRSYLSHIKLIKYDKIEIEWTNVQYVSDLKQGPDGNYYGVVSFEQVFRGFRDGKLIYQDVTRKNATVVLKTYEKNIEGTTKNVWDVLLSDIGVISTKAIQ